MRPSLGAAGDEGARPKERKAWPRSRESWPGWTLGEAHPGDRQKVAEVRPGGEELRPTRAQVRPGKGPAGKFGLGALTQPGESDTSAHLRPGSARRLPVQAELCKVWPRYPFYSFFFYLFPVEQIGRAHV